MGASRRIALRFAMVVTLVAATGAAAGCVSPTLPLPPPEEPTSVQPSSEQEGAWLVSGACIPGALVTVINEATGLGAVVEDRDQDGRYVVEIEAVECDFATVTQANEEGASAETGFVIVPKSPAEPGDESVCN